MLFSCAMALVCASSKSLSLLTKGKKIENWEYKSVDPGVFAECVDRLHINVNEGTGILTLPRFHSVVLGFAPIVLLSGFVVSARLIADVG